MQRTKYFNDTIPTDTQLNYTETSKINSLLRRQRSTCQLGIVDGFAVNVNATNNTQIDIGPGEGYTGGFYQDLDVAGENSGERISTISDTATGVASLPNTATGVNLADYTNSVKNYISVVYVETESDQLAEIYFPYAVHDTVVAETFSVSVLTETQWNALSVEQLRQRILVGIVTANGAGIALTAASLQQAVQPKTHPTTTQPTNITGATLIGISQDTLVGSGTLRFEFATKSMYWTAPGDTEGIVVSITSSGNYFVYSNNVAYWIRVSIVYDSLPVSDQTDTIYVRSLYGREVPLYSAQDTIHRDMVGTGAISTTNPHGISLDDISGGSSDHADLFHKNAISGDADAAQLECSIDAINDRILVNNIGGYSNSFLVDGTVYTLLTGVAAGANGSIQFSPITDITGRYMIYANSAGELEKIRIGDRNNELWDSNIHIIDQRNTTAGNGTITWNDAAETLTWTAPGEVAGAVVRTLQDYSSPLQAGAWGYYKLYSDDTDNWIIVYCDGDLGVANTSTFATSMDSTNQSEESILRLCSVDWDAATEQLSDLEDIRVFFSADTRDIFLEEHDADGRHTKILQQQLQAVNDQYAIVGTAQTNIGIYGYAKGLAGVYGSASETAVLGIASVNVGGRFSAVTSYGLQATASTIGVYGSAAVRSGVVGTALFTAVDAVAGNAIALNASAPNSAIMATAVGKTAGYFIASNTALVALATGDSYAASISAPNDALIAGATYNAIDAIAISNTAISAKAFGNTAILATADNHAVYAIAGTDYGVYAEAENNYALYAVATNINNAIAIYGGANTGGTAAYCTVASGGIGVFGGASAGTGVYASGAIGAFASGTVYGVSASGSSIGGYFEANSSRDAYGVGVLCSGDADANPVAAFNVSAVDSALYLKYSGRVVPRAGAFSVNGLPVSIEGAIKCIAIYETA